MRARRCGPAVAARAALLRGGRRARGARSSARAGGPRAEDDVDALARRRAGRDRQGARAPRGSAVVREVTLPSIERLVEDADLRRAGDHQARRATAPSCATRWRRRAPTPSGSPRATIPTARRPARWSRPTAPTGTGRCSPTRSTCRAATTAKTDGRLAARRRAARRVLRPPHNLRRVFGLDNRPGETDAEASRNRAAAPRRAGVRRLAARPRRADGLRRPRRTTTSCASSPTCAAPTRSIPTASR